MYTVLLQINYLLHEVSSNTLYDIQTFGDKDFKYESIPEND